MKEPKKSKNEKKISFWPPPQKITFMFFPSCCLPRLSSFVLFLSSFVLFLSFSPTLAHSMYYFLAFSVWFFGLCVTLGGRGEGTKIERNLVRTAIQKIPFDFRTYTLPTKKGRERRGKKYCNRRPLSDYSFIWNEGKTKEKASGFNFLAAGNIKNGSARIFLLEKSKFTIVCLSAVTTKTPSFECRQ